MESFNHYPTMATVASKSLRRIGRLGLESLGASTLAVYLRTDSAQSDSAQSDSAQSDSAQSDSAQSDSAQPDTHKYRRVFALANYPEPTSKEGSHHEQALVGLLAGDQIEVVEAACEHPDLAEHPWVRAADGWKFAASAPLTPLRSTTPVGYLIVAAHDALPFDEAARERLDDLASLMIERLELQRSQAEVAAEMDRMITTGILAAGVAHEINNPLSFVGGNIQFALRLLDEDFSEPERLESVIDIKEALRDALAGSRRVHEVVKDLHRLAGEGNSDDFTIETIDMLEPLKSSLNIARKHIEQRARLVTDINEVAEVMGNQSKLGQVFLNLLVNAAQAIPKGRIADNEVRVTTANRGGDVVVSISDTGTGISEENLAHIFAPYFTTKSRNEGTGLGLAISHNIIMALSGDIEIDTEPGKGTTFRVVLPSAGKATGGFATPSA